MYEEMHGQLNNKYIHAYCYRENAALRNAIDDAFHAPNRLRPHCRPAESKQRMLDDVQPMAGDIPFTRRLSYALKNII